MRLKDIGREPKCRLGSSRSTVLAPLDYYVAVTHASRCEPVFRGDPMADISKFSIVTYERKPGHWRAAITRKVRAGIVVGGDQVRSIVTPDEYASESEAQVAAEKLIRKL